MTDPLSPPRLSQRREYGESERPFLRRSRFSLPRLPMRVEHRKAKTRTIRMAACRSVPARDIALFCSFIFPRREKRCPKAQRRPRSNSAGQPLQDWPGRIRNGHPRPRNRTAPRVPNTILNAGSATMRLRANTRSSNQTANKARINEHTDRCWSPGLSRFWPARAGQNRLKPGLQQRLFLPQFQRTS